MIYTVTFNPSLDYIVSVEHFKLGQVNRTHAELLYPGLASQPALPEIKSRICWPNRAWQRTSSRLITG